MSFFFLPLFSPIVHVIHLSVGCVNVIHHHPSFTLSRTLSLSFSLSSLSSLLHRLFLWLFVCLVYLVCLAVCVYVCKYVCPSAVLSARSSMNKYRFSSLCGPRHKKKECSPPARHRRSLRPTCSDKDRQKMINCYRMAFFYLFSQKPKCSTNPDLFAVDSC
ncbi:MAG: hypothetical protein J3R72DRAFT_21790 [Linnemannia gamsii]|nr:MAG: hypothetical protein J3R72DRAFT_21790 [Linnemannia gamsii]